MREVLELGEAFEDVLLLDGAHAFEAEGFHVVAGEHTADDDGGLQSLEADLVIVATGQVAGQSAGEGISRAGRIVDVFQRVGGAAEEIIVFTEKEAAVLAFLHRDDARSEGLDFFAGLDQAGFLGQFSCLAVVEDEHVDALEQIEQRGLRDVDPEVHCVGDDELRFFHLVEDLQLQIRCDVGEEDVVARFEMVRKLRRERLEDIERD